MTRRGYSDSIHHALAFCAKHHPGRVSRYDTHSPLLTTANIAVILSRHEADDNTIVAAILKQLVDVSPQPRLAALQQNVARRFGGLVAGAVEAAADPRFDPLGRERTWKAARFEALGRIASSSPRVAEIWMASEIHICGVTLTAIRRLGVEYARSVSPAPPAELLWWHRALLEVLGSRSAEVRNGLLVELQELAGEVGAYLAGGQE